VIKMAGNEIFKKDLGLDGPTYKRKTVERYTVFEGELLDSFKASNPDGTLDEFTKKGIPYSIEEIGESTGEFRKGGGRTFKQYGFRAGSGKKKITIVSGHHGGERAGPLAALNIIKELLEPNEKLEKILSEAEIAIVPCVDPFGYDSKTRLCISPYTKREQRWPAEMFYEYFSDTNHWEDNVATKEVKNTKKFVTKVFEGGEEKLFLDLHETVPNNHNRITTDVAGDSMMAMNGLVTIESTKKESIGAATISNLYKHGKVPYLITGLDRYQEKMPFPQQLEWKSDGRTREGELISKIHYIKAVASKWAFDHLGAEALTFETFSKDASKRVEEQMIATEGAILDFMDLFPHMDFPVHKLPTYEEFIKMAENAKKSKPMKTILFGTAGFMLFGIAGAAILGGMALMSPSPKLPKSVIENGAKIMPAYAKLNSLEEGVKIWPEGILKEGGTLGLVEMLDTKKKTIVIEGEGYSLNIGPESVLSLAPRYKDRLDELNIGPECVFTEVTRIRIG